MKHEPKISAKAFAQTHQIVIINQYYGLSSYEMKLKIRNLKIRAHISVHFFMK